MAQTSDPNSSSLFRDYGGTIFFAVAVALLIRFFVVEAYRIPSTAMKPALEPGDTIFVEKWPYGLRIPFLDQPLTKGEDPQRGEIVVFSYGASGEVDGDQKRDYIKRVLGLPGDKVEMKAGKFYLNGSSTEVEGARRANCGEEKIPEGENYAVCWESAVSESFGPEKVPAGSIFVAGDMRSMLPAERDRKDKADQAEQRFGSWGVIPVSSLRGRALWIWLSLDPGNKGSSTGLFPSFRFDRMFRRVQ